MLDFNNICWQKDHIVGCKRMSTLHDLNTAMEKFYRVSNSPSWVSHMWLSRYVTQLRALIAL